MGSKLYVGNLPYEITEDALREAFGADGRQVREVSIITDRMTGKPRGFAFIQMGSDADAQSAIEALNGRELSGRTLKVSEAHERAPGGSGARGRAPQGRGGSRGQRW